MKPNMSPYVFVYVSQSLFQNIILMKEILILVKKHIQSFSNIFIHFFTYHTNFGQAPIGGAQRSDPSSIINYFRLKHSISMEVFIEISIGFTTRLKFDPPSFDRKA